MHQDVEEVPLAEAAIRLGVSQEALRKRLRRGTLTGHKRGTQWFVVLPTGGTAAGQPVATAGQWRDELAELRGEVAWLRERLEQAEVERAEMRRLLLATLPALPAPTDSAATPPERPATPSTTTEPSAGSPRPWWRFWGR